ncbi:MAG: hypothetical protein JO139_01740 [Alphaproteobacteria bacterium]|nr:hypothetical protein [Alphaproteobacteria bacterium]MBV8334106.1 hypothetical protein [Alphaproteobacteria bacterium]
MTDETLGRVQVVAAKSRAVRSEVGDRVATAAALIVGCVAIGSIAMPVASIDFNWERISNEGWNIYHASRAGAGEPLYTGDPARQVSYPFIWFYLLGWLKPLFGNMLVIGRAISVISLSCVAICSAFIVRRFGGRGPEMLLGAAATLGFIHAQAAAWIGTNEPQMLAEALTFGGLLCYLSGDPTPWRLAASAFLCCAGGFTKPIAAVVPLAVTLDLLWRDRRRFLIWCLCGIGALVLFAGLSYQIAGGDFVSEVFAKRPYRWERVAYHTKNFLRDQKIPVAVSLIYLCQSLPPTQAVLLRACFAGALIVGALVSGGIGVSYNAFIELAAVMGIVTALAFGRWRDQLASLRVGKLAGALLPVVIALPIATRSSEDLNSLFHLKRAWESQEGLEAAFRRSTEFLAQHPGDALCDCLLMCFEAGKPLIIEPFSARNAIETKRMDESQLIELIGGHRFAVIELPDVIFPYADQPDRISAELRDVRRFTATTLHFTEATLRAIDRYYTSAPRIGGPVFYLPKDDGS